MDIAPVDPQSTYAHRRTETTTKQATEIGSERKKADIGRCTTSLYLLAGIVSVSPLSHSAPFGNNNDKQVTDINEEADYSRAR